MEQVPERLKQVYVPTFEEIFSRITKRYGRGSGRGAFYEAELRRVEQVYSIIASKLSFTDKLPSPGSMPAFYAELAELASKGMYGRCISKLRRVPRILRSIYDTYRYRILASENPGEAARLRREAVGRMLSLVRREKCLGIVKETVIVLSKAPGIVMGDPRIIIAGAPSSGKSTLLSRLSRARPEIAAYPFTTKSILVGHLLHNGVRYQLIDTPGLLDRPLEERNEVELKAILALRHLANSVVFLVDPSPQAYYDFEHQVRLLEETVARIVDKGRIIVGVNKMDLVDREVVASIMDELRRRGYGAIHALSAFKGTGIRGLVEDACREALLHHGGGRAS